MTRFRDILFINLLAYSSLNYAALLNLPNTPLFITNTVPPNVIFEVDDSGSIDWEVMSNPYWEGCAYNPNFTGIYSAATTCGNYIYNNGLFYGYDGSNFHYYAYMYYNSDSSYNSKCGGNNSQSSVEDCGTTSDWRIYSSDLNLIYYNPSVVYQPWMGPCNSSFAACSAANFSSAQSNPVVGLPGNSLLRNLAGSQYRVWIDDKGFSGTRPLRGISLNVTNSGNGQVDLWDSNVTVVLNGTNAQIYSTTSTPTILGMNPVTVLQATLTDTSACYNVLGSQTLVRSIFNGQLAYNSTNGTGCMTLAQANANFANWYQYTRKRSFVLKSAISQVVNNNNSFRFGLGVSHQVNPFLVDVPPLPAQDYTSYNTSLLWSLFNVSSNALPSKLRSGLDNVGSYYMNNLSQQKINPITQPCQQNYAVLMTDGFWNDNFTAGYGDVDGDGIAITIADVARYYYKTNLNPSLALNQVAPNAFDPATWLHMVTYTVGLGVTGNLVAGSNGWPTPALGVSSYWGNPFTSQPAQIDDLWHAAYNSAGMFFEGQDPTTLISTFKNIMANVAIRNASAASVAQNSTVLNTTSQVYQGIFNSNNWQGELLAYSIGLDGVLATAPSWNANCVLTGGTCAIPVGTNTGIPYTNRVIITRNWDGTNTGMAFRWPSNYTTYSVSGSLPTNLANFLGSAPYPANTTTGSQITANQAYGQALLNYIRGDRSNEAVNNGTYSFRNRNGLLGDIIDSGPIYVGAPVRVYPSSLEASPYSSFASTYANRTPVVYVGANDGMLHGFRSSDGQEVLAYIPGNREIYQRLPSLSAVNYGHNFFVDGSPTEADVYFNSAWHTVLGGNMRTGGQGVFLLDITNPANFTEANANNIYLWEFSDRSDADVGYIIGSPTIAKVRTGSNQSKWALIFGNGYNNSQADGFASTSGTAALYILFIDGALSGGSWTLNSNYIKIPVGSASAASPNGLAQPYTVDVDGDYIVDYVYAGDLQGNVWKFDLRNNNPTNWVNNATKLFTASFATAGDQPITAPLIVGFGPNGSTSNGVMIYFGTGKFLEPLDNSTTGQVTQSFYALWDKFDGTTISKTQLVQQQIVGTATTTGGTFRSITNNTVNYTSSPQQRGWYINLIENGASSNNGERVVSQPLLRNSNVIFTTLIPSPSPCTFGGSSWLMEVSALTGGQPKQTPFDTNNDGAFTSADYITVNSTSSPAVGVKSTIGITYTPTVFMSPTKNFETKVVSGSIGLGTIQENAGGKSGRQNWRELY